MFVSFDILGIAIVGFVVVAVCSGSLTEDKSRTVSTGSSKTGVLMVAMIG